MMVPPQNSEPVSSPQKVPPRKRSRRDFITTGVMFGLTLAAAYMIRTRLMRPWFIPPNAEARLKAAGPLDGLSDELKRAFSPEESFEPMSAPKPGDWLADQPEWGQQFDRFVAKDAVRPDAKRTTIYLLPFGEFDPQWSPAMSDLESCASAFYQMPVKSLPSRPLDEKQFTSRTRNGRRQFLTDDLLKMLPTLLPADGFVILGITMQDLYPGASWQYVFGQADAKNHAGIYSFARYDPEFWGEPRTDDARKTFMKRSLGCLLHETCHMFGMDHCIYYRCLVNGTNTLEESDRSPIHLCPVCLRKLHHCVGFNVVTRYEALLKDYVRLGLEDESEWLEKRLKYVKNE